MNRNEAIAAARKFLASRGIAADLEYAAATPDGWRIEFTAPTAPFDSHVVIDVAPDATCVW